MFEIPQRYLVLLVSALDDAIKYKAGFLKSETIRDISDYEEHLLSLENFQYLLEKEYKKLEKKEPTMIEYDKIVRRKAIERRATRYISLNKKK